MARDEEADVPFLGSSLQRYDDKQLQLQPSLDLVRAWLSRRTRKHIAIAIGCLLLLFTIALHTNRSRISQLSSTALNPKCSNARLNPHNVKPPPTPNITQITSFWPTLKENLIDAGEGLPELEQPPFQLGPGLEEAVRARTDLLTQEQADIIRERHAAFVRYMPPYPEKAFKGRGIIILAGGRYSEYAATTLGVLRESGSTLPVEVWRRDEREEKHDWCHEITSEGMACRRLSDYLDTDILSISDGRVMKVLIMLFSSFEEFIYIDADNMALQKPELLFESKHYADTGVILWHDYWAYDNIDWLDYVVGISDNRSEALWSTTTYESGQIVWNKRRHWDSLLLVAYYNWYGPTLYYTLLNFNFAGYGDKDTFPLALRALKKPFYTVPDPPQQAWITDRVGERGAGMLQMAPEHPSSKSWLHNKSDDEEPETKPTAAFFHTTIVKWSHRAFICEKCLPIWHTSSPTDGFTSHYEDPEGELHNLLHNNQRIIDQGFLEYMPTTTSSTAHDGSLEMELRMWRAMEYAACRSEAWRHPRACMVGRRYMMNTFGFTFASEKGREDVMVDGWEEEGEDWVPGMEEAVCLVDPI